MSATHPSVGPPLPDGTIEIELRPDGSVRFEVKGAPGEGCEALEKALLEALQGEVESREHTPEFYARQATGIGTRLRALLGRS